jgi:hypothetical protein
VLVCLRCRGKPRTIHDAGEQLAALMGARPSLEGQRRWFSWPNIDLNADDFVALGAELREAGSVRVGAGGQADAERMGQRQVVDWAAQGFRAEPGRPPASGTASRAAGEPLPGMARSWTGRRTVQRLAPEKVGRHCDHGKRRRCQSQPKDNRLKTSIVTVRFNPPSLAGVRCPVLQQVGVIDLHMTLLVEVWKPPFVADPVDFVGHPGTSAFG